MEENNILTLKDGRRLGFAEYGDKNGQPLFFFHGWPGSRLRGRDSHEIVKKLHLRMISVDRPGYGLSDYQVNRKLLDWPKDIIELADALHLHKFAVVGISGGGPYAAVCAYKIPERITKTGIIVGLGPHTIKGAFEGVAWMGRIGWENYDRIPFLADISASISLVQSRYFPNLVTFAFRAKADREVLNLDAKKDMAMVAKEAYRQGSKGPALDLKIYTTDWGFTVDDIRSNVYLWYGDSDKNVSLNMGKYYAKHIKNSKLKIYPNEGHILLKRHAEEIFSTMGI
jgi:pimeloyl-ACP methyl ester carboxylesterase